MNDLINQFDNEFDNETKLSDAIFDIIETESVGVAEDRRVSDDTVFEVAARALTASASLDPESRYFATLREVSSFLTLAIHGSRPNGEVLHTDLLPIGHTHSTAGLDISDMEYRRRSALWNAADPRIADDYARTVVASAFAANPNSPECLYAVTRLRSLETGRVPLDIVLSPMVAAFGNNPYAGKNNRANRSARAKAQRRDRFGQFAYQGGGVRFYVRKADGSTVSVVGKYAGNGTNPDNIEVELTGVDGIKDGIYSVPTSFMEFIEAVLPEHVVSKITPMAPAIDVPVLNMKDLKRQALPSLWAATKVPAALGKIKKAVAPSKNYVSGDGYQVGMFDKLTPEVRAHLQDVVSAYSPKVIGDNGTTQLDPNKPVYQIVSSMSGENKVIALAQNWNDTQLALADEDDANPDNYNQAPVARLPKAEEEKQQEEIDQMAKDMGGEIPSPEEDIEEAPLSEMIPEDWEERQPNYFYSPDGRFGVSIGSAYAGERLIETEDDFGNTVIESEPILLDNAFTVVSDADTSEPEVLGVAFNWEQASRLLDLVDENMGDMAPDQSTIENEKAENSGLEDAVKAVQDWESNPTITEADIDQMISEGKDPMDVIQDILTPAGAATRNDADPIDTIKGILFPAQMLDKDELDDIDNMEAYDSAEKWLAPTSHFLGRSDASNNPSQDQLKRLRVAYTAHKHNLSLQQAVEQVLADPQNHTVAQVLSLTARVNMQPSEPKGPNGYAPFKAVPAQRKALIAIMKNRAIPEEEKNALNDQLHFLTQTLADSLIKRYNDDEKYPTIEREPTIRQRKAAGEVNLPQPEWVSSDIPEDQGGPSLGQMLKVETALANRQVPEKERQAFIKNHKNMTMEQFKDAITKFESYPYVGKFQPKYLETLMGANGATPRMLASFERIFDKPIVSPEEKESLLERIPYMTKHSAGVVLGSLKGLEDDYDSQVINNYLFINMDPDAEGLRIPSSYEPPAYYENAVALVKDSINGENRLIIDFEKLREANQTLDQAQFDAQAQATDVTPDVVTDGTDGTLHADEELLAKRTRARRRDAANMRKSLLRAAGDLTLAMFDRRVTPQGRRLLEAAVADLHLLRSSLDLRRRKNLTASDVTEFLHMIRDGIGNPIETETYGKLRNPNPNMLDALHEAAYAVHDISFEYKAGARPEFDDIDNMERSAEMKGDVPEGWSGSTGYWTDPSGRYTIMSDYETGNALYDGKFNPLKPNKIAYVENWKDALDTIYYNENVERLPDFTPEMADPTSPNFHSQSWRIAGLLENVDMEDIDNYVGDTPDMGRINAPAFYGPAFQGLPEEASYEDVINYLNSNVKEFYVFDFETTGLRKLSTPHIKNDPVQIAIAKVVDGKVVDSTSYYMNPGSPLSDWSAGREANSDGLKGPDGMVVTDAWLTEQMSKREAMEKFRSFVPDGAVLAGHNGLLFDMEVLNRTMKEAGLPEFKSDGFIDTYGLATYALPSPRNNPNKVAENEMPKRHTLTELGNFFGLDTEGMHNAENDVRATGELLYKILEHGQAGKALKGENFSVSEASNGFNFPKYKALSAAYKKKAAKWIADNADELIANGVSTDINDLIKFLSYPFNATGASSTRSGSMDDDQNPSLSEDVVTSQPKNMLPPTEKQLESIQRRLDIPGVFNDEARSRILETMPTLNRESIGSYIQLADALELKHRMREGLPIDDMRIPHWFIDQVIGYKPTSGAESTDIDEMSSENKDRTTIAAIRKSSKVDLSKLSLKRKPTKEQEDIMVAVAGGYDVRVQAMAGTGKTSTIELATALINAIDPKRKQVYIVFNSNIAEEGGQRLPDSVETRTSDSISFNANANKTLKEKFQYQSASPKHSPVSLYDNSIGLLGYLELLFPKKEGQKSEPNPVSKFFDAYESVKIKQMDENGNPVERPIAKEVLVKIVGDGIKAWSLSSDDELNREHFAIADNIYKPEMLDLAKFLWSDVMAPKDETKSQIKVEFEHMFKNWALTKPNWAHVDGYGKSIHGFRNGAPSVVYLDEAQDINEVFYQMLRDQSELHNNGLQLIAVGDSNQSLYEFRGAMDALNKFSVDVTLPLSMSFRSGEEIANAANLFLDIRYGKGKGQRLLGNPDINSRVVEKDTLKDYTAVMVNTNLGALESIITAGQDREEAVIGVTPNFKNDLSLLTSTVRWLITPKPRRNPAFKPKRMLPDLESFDTWKEVEDEYELHGSPMIGKYKSILNKAAEASKTAGGGDKMWDALSYIEGLTDRLRVRADGFVVPAKVGTAGKLGNAIKYEIKGGKLMLNNDSFLKSWQLKPYQGLKNNKGILKHNGFVSPRTSADGKPVYHYEAPLQGDGKAQLQALVDDLSGSKIDIDITTVHRGKGLEYDRVLIWNDFPNPEDNSEALALKLADQILPEDPKDRKKMLKDIAKAERQSATDEEGKPLWEQSSELNKYYTAFTRAKLVLDPGGLDWIFNYTPSNVKSTPKLVTKAEAEAKKTAEKALADRKSMAEGEFGQVAKGVTYEVTGGNLIVAGKTEPYKKLLEGMGFVYREDGKVWFLRIGKSADAAEALGKRMKAIENLRKRINLS